MERDFSGCTGPQSNRGPATTDIKDARLRGRLDLDALPGPATTEIDSAGFRGGRCLIAIRGPRGPIAWEESGDEPGTPGKWEWDRITLHFQTRLYLSVPAGDEAQSVVKRRLPSRRGRPRVGIRTDGDTRLQSLGQPPGPREVRVLHP